MIYSMTGYGRAEVQDADSKFTVEMKSVNHRYLDVGIRMPKRLGLFESRIRTLLKAYIRRGKIDVSIAYENFAGRDMSLVYNEALAADYMAYARKIQHAFDIADDMTTSKLMLMPEVMSMDEVPIDEACVWSMLEQALTRAAGQMQDARADEGGKLAADICRKLDLLTDDVTKIEQRSPLILAQYKSKLEERTKELLLDTQIEDTRIAAEVVLFADKICTDEETVRLACHIGKMQDVLAAGKPDGVGKELDFVAQEMNREANTILSKATDGNISDIAIEIKTEIEKIREQIQNIE